MSNELIPAHNFKEDSAVMIGQASKKET